jgi:hypothetical protein
MSQPKLHYMKTATTRPRIHCSSGRFRDSGFASPAHRLFRPHGDREARSWPSRASSHCLSDFSRSKLALRATSYVVLVVVRHVVLMRGNWGVHETLGKPIGERAGT